jgi:tetratricopeptide (TPR) repeat protein
VPLPAEYDGLHFLFGFYHFDFPYDSFFDPAYKSDTILAVHYAQVSRQMGYTVAPPETFINNLGYGLLGSHQFDRAFYFFDLNIHNYPNSFNVYDSMGDLWLARGDKAKAAENFKKALSLRENPDTRKKLEKLQQ